MRQRCKEVGLEPTGKREALKRRLKEHFKNEKLIEAGKLVCFDELDFNFAWKLLAYRLCTSKSKKKFFNRKLPRKC
jgi:hypothetical protein